MRGNFNLVRNSAGPAQPQGAGQSRNNRRRHFSARDARIMILRGSLPAGAVIRGNLTFDGVAPIIPPGTRFRGNLTLRNCLKGTQLGTGIKIDGAADFTGTAIAELPRKLHVTVLDTSGTAVRVFPPSLRVDVLIQHDEFATRSMRRIAAEVARKSGCEYPPSKRPGLYVPFRRRTTKSAA